MELERIYKDQRRMLYLCYQFMPFGKDEGRGIQNTWRDTMAKYCEYCGKPLKPGAKFCEECGAPVSAPAASAKKSAPPTVTIPVDGPVLSVEVVDEVPETTARSSSKSREKSKTPPEKRSSKTTRAPQPAKKTKNKMPGGRKFLALLLTAVDIALLVTIVKAANAEKAQDYGKPFGDASSYATPAPYSTGSGSGSSDSGSYSTGSGSGSYSSGSGSGSSPVIPAGGDSFIATPAPLSGLDLSTLERPSESDFGWYEDICDTGTLPDNAEFITDGDEVIGSWKGYIYYDFRDVDGSSADEYLNVTITVSGGDASLLLDWYQIAWNGEAPFDESQDDDTLFTGTWGNGELHTDGNVPIHLLYFFRTDGKQQYALGNMELSDGATGYIALVRP